MVKIREATDAEIAAAREKGRQFARKYPLAIDAWYDRKHDVISVILADDRIVTVARSKFQELADQPAVNLSKVEIWGTAVHFPRARAGFGIDNLLRGEYGSASWMAQILGRNGGKVKTKAKAIAARRNGRKGGRPRKKIA